MTGLTAAELDAFADQYYLNRDGVADLGIEETGQQRSVDQTLRILGDAARVLEMGYGTGMMTAELLRRGVGIDVVEGSARLAAAAREAQGAAGLVVHHAMFEDFMPEEPYDAVLALHIAEHVADPRTLFEHVHGWLRPGGAFVVVVPNSESLHRRLAVKMGLQTKLDDLSDRDLLVGHLRVYDFARLSADLEAAGFRVEVRFGYQLKVVPNSMMLEWPQALIDALIDISPELPPELLANIGVRAVRE